MLQIITHGYTSPDSTYFRVASAQPELEQDEHGVQVLKLVNGTGTRRSSWGEPGVTSTVLLNADDLAAIHVGFFHKHGGGQFYRYYAYTGEAWEQVTWQKLSDADRERVLNTYEDRAPSFAKVPGKVRTSYARPSSPVRTTYKLVEMVDSRYFSVYSPETEYVMGKRLMEKAVTQHGGGYYSYPTAEGVEVRFSEGTLFPGRCYDESMELALIECEVSGTIIEYGGKLASTYLRPVKVLKTFSYASARKVAC